MSEPSNKQLKIIQNLPEEIVVHVSSFFPIKYLLQNRSVSKLFTRTEIRSRDLDFSGICSERRTHTLLEAISMFQNAINIIQNVFNKHQGSEINRFVLSLNRTGGEESIASWINTCIRKNIQELVLDFSKSNNVKEIPIDFWAIETLRVLTLRWCKFETPNDSPKGLKLLRTLSLTRATVTRAMTTAIFGNCFHLELLELIECTMSGSLKLEIPAKNHKKFKSLVVSSTPDYASIILYAPTLEYFKYDGHVTNVISGRTDALKEVHLHYKKTRRSYGSSTEVVSFMKLYTKVYVLSTTNVFVEAVTIRYNHRSGRLEKNGGRVIFCNLTDFKISFKAPTICTLFDIAEFLKDCPKLERVEIDFQGFTFEPRLLFWKMHQKEQIENNDYLLQFLNEVKIVGFKGHWHEREIVDFFVKNAPSLVNMELVISKKATYKGQKLDSAAINSIKSISPAVKFVEV